MATDLASVWEMNAIVKTAGGILGFFPELRSLFFADDSSAPVAPSFEGSWKQPMPGCEARMRDAVPIDEIVRLAARMDALVPAPVTFLAGGIELDRDGFRAAGVGRWNAVIIRQRGCYNDERSMQVGGFKRDSGAASLAAAIAGISSTSPAPPAAEVLDIARGYARWGFHLITARARARRPA